MCPKMVTNEKKRRGKTIMLLDSTGGPKYIVGFSRIQDLKVI